MLFIQNIVAVQRCSLLKKMRYYMLMQSPHSLSLILNATIASDLDVIGDRWVLLILRDMFIGRTRFESLRKHTGASKSTLSRRLDTLIGADIVAKQQCAYGSKRMEYVLTQKGSALYSTSLLAWQWELVWADNAPDTLPNALLHSDCGQPLSPVTVCQYCQQPLQLEDVEWPHHAGDFDIQMQTLRQANKQRRVRSSTLDNQADKSLATVSDLIGDRWTLLLLIAALLGLKRYDEFEKHLTIASNILAQRLNLLVENGIFYKKAYQQNPIRYSYLLTEKGKSLCPLILLLRQWATHYSSNEEGLRHGPCGKPLILEVLCGSCQTPPTAETVSVV